MDTLETSVLLPDTEDSSSTALPIPMVLSMQLRNWNETKSIHLFTVQHTSGYRVVEPGTEKGKWTGWCGRSTHLLVEQHIDDGVVQRWALCKEGRDGHAEGSETHALVEEDNGGQGGIRGPCHQEAKDHQDAHAGHFLLSLLGGGRLLLLGCSLYMVEENRWG